MDSASRRLRLEAVSLEQLPFLKGLSLEFDSVAAMFAARCKEMPDKPFVLYYDQVVTYAQTNRRANRVAHYLKQEGVEKGDVVSIMVLNSPEVYYTMLGAQKLGAVAGMVNFALKGPEIAYVLDNAKPKVIFVSSEFMADFALGFKAAAHKPLVVEVKTETSHGIDLGQGQLSDILAQHPADEMLVPQQALDPFMLLYSSGTTGRPKGILLSNQGQLSICRDMARLGLVQGDDVMLILLPMFHINPLSVWTFPMSFCGQTLCVRKAFSPADFWPAITDNGVTILMGVPAMYNYVYYSIDADTIDRANLKLKYAFCGAAPLSVELIRGFKEKYGVDIIEGYGLTEGTGVSTANPPLGKRKPGSIGLPLPEQEIKIMDDDLNEMAAGEKGEICIKGPANMLRYFNNPEATAETLIDGWLRTGDIATMDEEGYTYIVDRKKDMINRGGENIYPREIEIELDAHPDIVAAAVIGVPDDALGERVKAIIEIAKPGALTADDVKAYLSERLAQYKVPEFVEITGEIPRNPTGKILKRMLKKMEMEKRAQG